MQHRVWSMIVAASIILLSLTVATAYFLLGHGQSSPQRTTAGELATATFTDHSQHISFSYPTVWTLQSQSSPLDATAAVSYITLSTGTAGTPEVGRYATVTIERWNSPASGSFEERVHTVLHDDQQLLDFSPCPFHNPTSRDCLLLTDQNKWIDDNRLPIQASVFFDGPNAIYAVAWGQTDTLDLGSFRQRLLRTIQFLPSS